MAVIVRKMSIVKLILFSTLLHSAACTECLSPTTSCSCFIDDHGQKVINCRYKGLQQIPTFTSTGVVYDKIIFTSTEATENCIFPECNNITRLKTDAFTNLKVKAIDIRNNPVSSFDHNAFHGLEDILIDLSIEGNGIESPPYASIANLRRMQSLHFDNFRQVDLTHANTDLNFPQLQSLTVSKVQGVSLIEPSVFVHIQKLTRLSLDHMSSLISLPVGAILTLHHLQFLSVTESKITAIYGDSFHTLSNLKYINFDGNSDLVSIDRHAFRGVGGTVESLVLSRSGLSADDLVIFQAQNWTALTHLNLGFNHFGFIPPAAFQTMNHLSLLNLQDTALTLINKTMFTGLLKLKTLDLGYNNIRKIDAASFQGCPGLKELRLDGQSTRNTIDINFKSFYFINQSVERLFIENNNIQADAFWGIIRSLPNLVELDAEMLSLQEIPDLAFANNIKLYRIDLSGNDITTVSQATFFGPIDTISVIDLQNNNINTIDQCIVNDFVQSPKLILQGNPLVCDCRISWFYDWVTGQPDPMLASYGTACKAPANLRGKMFFQFQRSELGCTSDDIKPVCTDMHSTSVAPMTSSVATTTVTTAGLTGPSYTMFITQTSNTFVTVAWVINDSTNITGFSLEIESSDGKQIMVIKIHRNIRTYTVYQLTPDSVHVFCLKLMFKYGIDNRHQQCVTSGPPLVTTPSAIVVG